ncbi:MAG: rhomboid family intramembrane serine protease [Myxococcota bacterium]
MLPNSMEILSLIDPSWRHPCEAALSATEVPYEWLQLPGDIYVLMVPASESERAVNVLSQQLAEQLARPGEFTEPNSTPALATAIGLAALLLTFFWVTGPADLRSTWFQQGVFVPKLVVQGQSWRFITGITLHSDIAHALSNAVFLVVFGWACAERLGGGVMLLGLVLTGVAGFAVSWALSDSGATLGASGGVFGLLGIATGRGLRMVEGWRLVRSERMRILGAAVALVAMTGFSPQSNIYAHLGGVIMGFVLGVVLPRRFMPSWLQGVFGVIAGVSVYWSWKLAEVSV